MDMVKSKFEVESDVNVDFETVRSTDPTPSMKSSSGSCGSECGLCDTDL